MISTALKRRDFPWQSRPDLHVLSYHDGDTGLPQPQTALVQVPSPPRPLHMEQMEDNGLATKVGKRTSSLPFPMRVPLPYSPSPVRNFALAPSCGTLVCVVRCLF